MAAYMSGNFCSNKSGPEHVSGYFDLPPGSGLGVS